MNIQAMSPNQIRNMGLEILAKSLGPIGMARFIQQFDTGKGDYTRDRIRWLDQMGLDEILTKIESKRKTKK